MQVSARSGPTLGPMDVAELLTTTQAARLLRVSPSTVRRYAARGWLVPTQTLPTGYLRWEADCVRRQWRELVERRARGELDYERPLWAVPWITECVGPGFDSPRRRQLTNAFPDGPTDEASREQFG